MTISTNSSVQAQPQCGKFVLVVGPSGSGKDTLVEYARTRLEGDVSVHFVRRFINRPASVGDSHEALGTAEFMRRSKVGEFSLHWKAHGHHYAIPQTIEDHLAKGETVVATGSRTIVDLASKKYRGLVVVKITVPEAILIQRISGGKRENAAAAARRLNRRRSTSFDILNAVEIDNSGPPRVGGERLVRAIKG